MKKFSDAIVKSMMKLRQEFKLIYDEKQYPKGNIRYGRSGSLSHLFERTIAEQLAIEFPDLYFFVDYPISLYNEDIKFIGTLYYDVLVVKMESELKGKIVGIIDLKIDLGYIDNESYGIPSDFKKNPNYEINNEHKFSKRETKFNSASIIKCKKIVNSTSDNNRIVLEKTLSITRVALIATKGNDHGRADAFKNSMEKNGYKTFYLQDKEEEFRNDNFETDFNEIIKNAMREKKEELDEIVFNN